MNRIIQHLPKRMVGPTIELDAFGHTSWQRFQTMPQDMLFPFVRMVLNLYLRAPLSDNSIRAVTEDKASYDGLRASIRLMERDKDVKAYWIYSRKNNRIVGSLDAYRPHNAKLGETGVTLGYEVMEDQRGNGFAPTAAHLFAHTVAELGIASHFYVDALRDASGDASRRCMQKAGFREMPKGSSTPNGRADSVERQFVLELPLGHSTRPKSRIKAIRATRHP